MLLPLLGENAMLDFTAQMSTHHHYASFALLDLPQYSQTMWCLIVVNIYYIMHILINNSDNVFVVNAFNSTIFKVEKIRTRT